MIVPGCLNAGILGNGGAFPLTLSINTPANGSTIISNSTPEAISGVATTTAGAISTIQWELDGGSWNNFSFTAGASVNYSGGNAGQIGAGSHTLQVKAVDSSGNTVTVGSTYSISSASPPSYSWAPYDAPNGASTYLSITGSTPLAAVSYTQTIYNSTGGVVTSAPPVTLGTTDGSGNFSYTGTASWPAGGWTGTAVLSVGGTPVYTYNYANFGQYTPTYSYGPSTAPTGTTITLNIASSWCSATVTETTVFYPSGSIVGPVTLGTSSPTGNFSFSGTSSWGTDTSCSTTVYMDGVSIGSFGFAS